MPAREEPPQAWPGHRQRGRGAACPGPARAVDLLGHFDAMAAGAPALVSRERAAVLSGLGQERMALQTFISAERQTFMGDVDRERAAVMAALRAERVAALQELDGVARDWGDHAFERATQLLV